MPFSRNRDISFALLVTLAILSAFGCRSREDAQSIEAEAAIQSEPESYSATLVRTIDDGSASQSSHARIARLGEMRREEWSEQGQRLAVISRPDMGKLFLLDLDKQIYVERALGLAASEAGPDSSNASRSQSMARADKARDNQSNPESPLEHPVDAVQIERAFDDAPSPQSVARRAIAGQTIENHPCEGFEQRATFPDGRVEITRVFRALDLAGLAIRIESVSEDNVKIITERRDVKIEVSPDEFIVPAGFKKVERLDH